MTTRRILPTGFVVAAFLMFAAPVLAQGVGGIGGTVMDSTGAVLPGVTLTLSSAQGGTLGGSQETTSDARGNYQFIRLVPGTYSVRGQMQGFRTVEQRNIVVNADATARADLTLSIGQLEEGVVVSGEAPLLDTTSALKQTVLSQEILQALPNRIDVWSITRVIPSVVASKVDVGGSESFQQSGITVHGTSNENGYYIDGMNVSSTQSSGSIATFYLDPYAFEEANFRAGNAPAEASTGGLVFNMISRTGTNQFHGGTVFNGTNHALGFDNVDSRAGEPAAAQRAGIGEGRQTRSEAHRRHPVPDRLRRMAGGPHQARQAVVVDVVPPFADPAVSGRQL